MSFRVTLLVVSVFAIFMTLAMLATVNHFDPGGAEAKIQSNR
jgi:hypothetical protein